MEKEIKITPYEQKYKEALSRATFYNNELPTEEQRKMLFDIFPELKKSEDEMIRKAIHIYLDWLDGRKDYAPKGSYSIKDMIAWLEKQKDYIKLPNSAYTSNKDVTEFADKYSHIVWEKLMNNFKKIENYSIGCNDVSDIVLNAIIDTYIWLEGKGQIKESHISQHESKTCEENNEFLTNEDERIKGTLKGFVKGYSAFINGQWRLGDFTVNRLIDWLEKQGKQQGKSALEAWKDMRLEVYQQTSGNRHEPNCSDDSTKMFSLNDIDEIIEKISEQKPTENAKKLDANKVI